MTPAAAPAPGPCRLQASAPSGASLAAHPDGRGARRRSALRSPRPPAATEGDVTGTSSWHEAVRPRRIPFWLRVDPRPADASPRPVSSRPASTRGIPAAAQSRVSRYRYPRARGQRRRAPPSPDRSRSSASCSTSPSQNFGVVVVSRARGRDGSSRASSPATTRTGSPATQRCRSCSTRTSPASVSAVLAAGACQAAPGHYDIVFDSRTAAGAGKFTFRFWVNDVDAAAPSGCCAPRRPRDDPVIVRVATAGRASTRAPPSRRSTARRRFTFSGSALRSTRAGSTRDATGFTSRSRTTRRRGTWRTSRAVLPEHPPPHRVVHRHPVP